MKNIQNFLISKNVSIKTASNKMSRYGLRCLVVVDKNKFFLGTLSVGDIRKFVTKGFKIQTKVEKVYQKNSFFLKTTDKIKNPKSFLINKKLDLIPIINDSNKIINIITQENYKSIKNYFQKKIKQNFSVLIMAGGKGTRLAPFTHVLPKPLIPINKKTLIEHVFEQFEKNNVKAISLSVNYKSKTLISYVNEIKKSNLKINFCIETKPLGTIGILKKVYKNFKRNILVTNCDTIIKDDYNKILRHHIKNNFGITLVLAEKKQKLSYGTCQIQKSTNELISLKEKPNISYFANTGFFFIKKDFVKHIPSNSFYNATDLIKKCLLRGEKIGTFLISEKKWLDAGQWKEYKEASSKLRIN